MSDRRAYQNTEVSESKSLMDIEEMLRRHGVDAIRWTNTAALIRIEFAWPYKNTTLPFRIDLKVNPAAKDKYGYALNDRQKQQERRRLLRVLLHHIKAKLVAVEEGLVDMEMEFLPYLVGAGDRTAGEAAIAQLAYAAENGKLDAVDLLGLPSPRD